MLVTLERRARLRDFYHANCVSKKRTNAAHLLRSSVRCLATSAMASSDFNAKSVPVKCARRHPFPLPNHSTSHQGFHERVGAVWRQRCSRSLCRSGMGTALHGRSVCSLSLVARDNCCDGSCAPAKPLSTIAQSVRRDNDAVHSRLRTPSCQTPLRRTAAVAANADS